ncbi:hypothetical protein M2317_003439 [Microbacterium sp. ZKA21]|uniref:hypothetical protein n=1 Tax=Microbacterium sp. ZKA21 TaxID=3381694 RepID=UPI003D254B31
MTTTQKQWFSVGAAILSAVLLAGCSAATTPTSTAEPVGDTASDSASAADTGPYECNGRFVDPATFDEGLPADQLPEQDATGIAAAVDDAGGDALDGDLSEWIVGARADGSITLLRPLEGEGQYDVVIYDRMAELPATGEAGWMLTSSSSCALTLDASPFGPGNVALDSSAVPAADSTTLALRVTERACNSGEDAEGRVELVSLEETEDAVIIRVAVRPREGDGAYTCQSNPPTPFTVELAEPLGDREVLDGSLVVPQPIPVQQEISF